MTHNTVPPGGLPPDRPFAPPTALAEILAAHEVAARLVEQVLALHAVLPHGSAARGRISPFLTEASRIENLIVADLRAALAAEMSPGDAAAVVAHADRLHDIRPRLGRFVDRLILAEALRRLGLAA